MSAFNATQANNALPITQSLFGAHPGEWADYFSEDYLAPAECYAEGVSRAEDRRACPPVNSAHTSSYPGLYNHVDVIGLVSTVGAQGFAQIRKLEGSSLRILTRGEFPKTIAKHVFDDADHNLFLRNHIKDGSLPGVVSCITYGGSPFCDIGGDDGRKAFAHWRRRGANGIYQYKGPKTIIADRDPPKFNMNYPQLGKYEPLMKATGIITNMIYRQCDFEEEGGYWIPEEYLLVSINALNQLSPSVFANFVLKRDGIHMVPNVQKLVREGTAEIDANGKVTTQIMTKNGQRTFVEYPHEFVPTVFPATSQSDHYQILVVFGPRIIKASLDEGTPSEIDFNTSYFKMKPKRINEKGVSFLPPYKLKRDGETMVVHITHDEVVFETLRSRVVMEAEEGHHSPVKLVLQCEMRVEDTMVLIPHVIWLGGRMICGPTINKMMDRTDFQIAGVEFRRPEYHATMQDAVVALALAKDSGFPADGVVGSGSGSDVAGKIIESIDIRMCDDDVVCKIQSQVAPRTVIWEVGDTQCVADMSAPPAINPYGDARHSRCPIKEFEAFERGHDVVLREVRTRDKRDPNSVKRIMQVIPRSYTSDEERPPTLIGCMSSEQKRILKSANIDF